MKKTILIVLFIFSFFNTIIFAQNYNKKQIDSLLKLSYSYMGNIPYKIIPLNLEIVKASKKIGYRRGVIIAYAYISKEYYNLDEIKKALIYISKAEAEANIINDPSLLSSIFRIKAMCFARAGLHTVARKELIKALAITDSIKDLDEQHIKRGFIYRLMALAIVAENNKPKDSSLYYSKKSYKEFLSMKNENFLKNDGLSIASLELGHNFTILKQNDSAEYYFKKGFSIANKIDYTYGKAYSLKLLGELYFIKQEYKQSIIYYNEAIIEAKKNQLRSLLKDCYIGLSKVYNAIGNTQEYKKSLSNYIELTDSLKVLNDKIVDESVEYVIKEKEKDYEYGTLKLQKIKTFLIGIILIIAVLLFFIYKKYKFERIKRIKNTELLKKKKEKLERLTDSNRITLQEVLQLAIDKAPSFNAKFQELEPDFYDKLNQKAIVPLNYNDLLFCAMIRLGFTTKEIAQNLNSTVGAVETRKYRLRKKFNMVSSEEDLTLWIMNL
ncbi:hypothetical protein [Flavobacterium sp. 140616W15]|uniref:helix-turn-helix transcriptional regulator n=1 Tax=Flavobacterium sp. 140616W15 TaxID=2478552 RepID=UPI000F0C7867|nr:hypothetical protein [Flavobacterium sp. 140616W15]AYN05573.1 hypothetical protein EAG11_16510 [Flavobacterium sp. 140616W15]